MNNYFKALVEKDREPIVIADINHIIVYMNEVAIFRFAKRGGADLIGKSLLHCHNEKSCELIKSVVESFVADENLNYVYTYYSEKWQADVYMVALRDENKKLIGYYEKHECRVKETMKPYEGVK